MPYMREGSVKVSDHWVRSPLDNVNAACGTCHKQDEQALKDRILTIQNNTASLLRKTEVALERRDGCDRGREGRRRHRRSTEGSADFHRKASMRYDFVMSENSTGFHSPQEAARVLANAIDMARQAQIAAERLTATAQK